MRKKRERKKMSPTLKLFLEYIEVSDTNKISEMASSRYDVEVYDTHRESYYILEDGEDRYTVYVKIGNDGKHTLVSVSGIDFEKNLKSPQHDSKGRRWDLLEGKHSFLFFKVEDSILHAAIHEEGISRIAAKIGRGEDISVFSPLIITGEYRLSNGKNVYMELTATSDAKSGINQGAIDIYEEKEDGRFYKTETTKFNLSRIFSAKNRFEELFNIICTKARIEMIRAEEEKNKVNVEDDLSIRL